ADVLREALPQLRPLVKPNVGSTLFMRRLMEADLVKCLTEKGDRTAVEAVLRGGLTVLQAGLPAGHPEIAVGPANLAAELSEQKRCADAEPLLLVAHESLKSHPQAAATGLMRHRADVAERLVKLYEAWGRPADAAKWQAERAKHGGPPAISE